MPTGRTASGLLLCRRPTAIACHVRSNGSAFFHFVSHECLVIGFRTYNNEFYYLYIISWINTIRRAVVVGWGVDGYRYMAGPLKVLAAHVYLPLVYSGHVGECCQSRRCR
ncbi:hypothetical protein HDV63DRAFT_385722 [Trichoderma sp. SZMC 28014]